MKLIIQIMNNEVVKKAANTAANIIVEEISSQIFNAIVNYDESNYADRNPQTYRRHRANPDADLNSLNHLRSHSTSHPSVITIVATSVALAFHRVSWERNTLGVVTVDRNSCWELESGGVESQEQLGATKG